VCKTHEFGNVKREGASRGKEGQVRQKRFMTGGSGHHIANKKTGKKRDMSEKFTKKTMTFVSKGG